MKPRAFTLIEVLVALGIFALAAVALGAAYANVIAGYRQAGDRPNREQEMRAVHEEVAREPDRAKVVRGGTLALPDGCEARWSATLAENRLPGLFRVKLQCALSAIPTREPEIVEETFMLFRPGWTDPGGRAQTGTR